jgi:hypothetical protein
VLQGDVSPGQSPRGRTLSRGVHLAKICKSILPGFQLQGAASRWAFRPGRTLPRGAIVSGDYDPRDKNARGRCIPGALSVQNDQVLSTWPSGSVSISPGRMWPIGAFPPGEDSSRGASARRKMPKGVQLFKSIVLRGMSLPGQVSACGASLGRRKPRCQVYLTRLSAPGETCPGRHSPRGIISQGQSSPGPKYFGE